VRDCEYGLHYSIPTTKRLYDAIVVFVDRLIEMVYFAPTTMTCSVEDVVRLSSSTVFKHHSLPSEISDRNP
jgi:hypothetical protein